GLPAYAKGKAEGFLFPATYNVTSSTTATSLLTQMVARYKQVSSGIGLEAAAAKLGLSPYQVVTIASLIEAEVKRPQDYSQVAEVIINRLHRGMKLELDSTVNYALGTTKPLLSQSDLKVESAYNTYLHTGLPPGPIDSPGQAALQAALNPATGNLIYFVTVDPDTGETLFTNSLKQFNEWKVQAQAKFSAAASSSASPSP
ncbi:MAG TPA: endolytic transglycosylase MltG, partial [Acidothermaceae bacterium]|nr:endolytic transglycosylase MltG [Acidothermaceae bacterium]